VQCECHIGKQTLIARINRTNHNWNADFTFSRNFCFLVPISRYGQMRVLPPSADVRDSLYSEFSFEKQLTWRKLLTWTNYFSRFRKPQAQTRPCINVTPGRTSNYPLLWQPNAFSLSFCNIVSLCFTCKGEWVVASVVLFLWASRVRLPMLVGLQPNCVIWSLSFFLSVSLWVSLVEEIL